MIRYFVCFFISATLLRPVRAQELSAYNVRKLTIEDGLPQGFVTGIVQDKQGFMWLATRDGLARYDGRSVKVFSHVQGDTTTIANNVIKYLSMDGQGNIWIQSDNAQMDVIDPFTERIRHVPMEKILPRSRSHGPYESFNRLILDHYGYAYFLSRDYPPFNDKLHCFSSSSFEEKAISFPAGEYPNSVTSDQDGIVWVTTLKSLYFIDKVFRLRKICDLPDGLNQVDNGSDRSAYFDSNGNLYVYDGYNCIRYNKRTHAWKRLMLPASPGDGRKIIQVDADGSLYMCINNRVYKVSDDEKFSLIWINEVHPNNIVSMFIDQTNVMWVGASVFGVRMIDLNSSGFLSYPIRHHFFYDALPLLNPVAVNTSYSNIFLNESYFGRTAYDKNGNLWIDNFLYSSIDGQRTAIMNLAKITQHHAEVHNISNLENKTETPENRLSDFCFDADGNCWVFLNAGLQLGVVDLQTNRFNSRAHLDTSYGIPGKIFAIDNKLCLVYNNAVQLYDPTTGQFTIYKEQPGLEALHGAEMLMGATDPADKNILWLASRGSGLIRLDLQKKVAVSFTTKQGLPNNTVYCIVADAKGYLWCSSNKGIFRFNPRDYAVISFTAKDGLQGNEFNRYQYMHFADGRIAFGGTEGFTVFHPDSIRVDRYQPQVALTDVSINNEPLAKYTGINDKSIVSIDTLHLNYDQNFLSFGFAGLQFNDPEKLQYRYMLTGVDKKWVDAGTQNTANYTNLAPGDYDLKLNVSNTAGLWSSQIKTIHIVIDPPWWKTWWAYALYLIVSVSIVIAIFRIRLNQAKARQEVVLKQKEAEQLKAMDEIKSRFFSNITHEFRTPLSLILSPVEQLQKQDALPGPVKKELAVVHRNANQLLRLVNQLLDMNKIESGTMTLSFSRGDIEAFTEECLQSFKTAAAAKHIRLSFTAKATRQDWLFDADKLQKIIYNLLSNAIKFTPENGVVSVELIVEAHGDAPAQMQLRVADSGIGIAEAQLPFIFDRFYQVDNSATRKYEGTGIGLSLVRELLQLMKGSISVTSHPGKGSSFTVALPLQKAGNEDLPQWTISAGLLTDSIAAPVMQDIKPGAENRDLASTLVMVVEDNEELREFIAQTLGRQYRTLTAPNGEQALELARRELPDVVISDVMMPGMDGYTLCHAIKNDTVTDHIAVMLLTARTAHESVIEGLASGADDYITKPFHIDELELRMRNILDRKEKLRVFFQLQLSNLETVINVKEIDDPFISNLYTIIDAHLDDTTLGVEKLATKAAVSSRTLNRKLSSIVGLSANELIKQYRLKRSIEFLRSGSNVSEAAYSVGFETHSHFSTSFKSFFGITPTEYLHQNQ